MQEIIHEDKTFDKISYSGQEIRNREFLRCTFTGCDFSDSNFSNNRFVDCSFSGCNLSLLKLVDTGLSNAFFHDCKLLGVNFNECRDFLFSVRFEGGVLDFASFAGKRMPKTCFLNISMKSMDFSRANLQGALFQNTNLEGTTFSKTNLKETDFLTAYGYTIDPEANAVAKALFSRNGVSGLLSKYGITIE